MRIEIKPGMRVTLNRKQAHKHQLFARGKSYLLRDAGTVLAKPTFEIDVVKVKWDKLKAPELLWIGFLLPLEQEEERRLGEK